MWSRHSNPGEIILLTLTWMTLLIVLDTSLRSLQTQKLSVWTTPRISLSLPHLGCNPERQREVVQILSSLPGLEHVTVRAEESLETSHQTVSHTQSKIPCMAHLTAAVQTEPTVDLMQLTRALRALGMPLGKLEFGGLPEFALVINVPDLACQSCQRAAVEALTPLEVSMTYYATTHQGMVNPAKITSFEWLDSTHIDPVNHTITVKVLRHRVARVDELIRAFDGFGLLPLSITVMADHDPQELGANHQNSVKASG